MRKPVVIAMLAATTLLLSTQPAQAVDSVNTKRLRDAVTVNGILGHERALQRIANANGGIRASGTPGVRGVAELRAGRVAQGRLHGPYAGLHLPVLP